MMLQIRELLCGLLLIGCAGKKRSLCAVVVDAGSPCGGSSRVTRRPSRVARGAASSGWRHPRVRGSALGLRFSRRSRETLADTCACARAAWHRWPPGSLSRWTFASFRSISHARCTSVDAGGGDAETEGHCVALSRCQITKTTSSVQCVRGCARFGSLWAGGSAVPVRLSALPPFKQTENQIRFSSGWNSDQFSERRGCFWVSVQRGLARFSPAAFWRKLIIHPA